MRRLLTQLAISIGGNIQTVCPKYITHQQLGHTRLILDGSAVTLSAVVFRPQSYPSSTPIDTGEYCLGADATELVCGLSSLPTAANFTAKIRVASPL